jgi:hypothetical protein
MYYSFNLVVGRKILLDIMSDLRTQWLGLKRLGSGACRLPYNANIPNVQYNPA